MRKVTNIYLVSASLLIVFIHISDFIPKINNFEDELITLTSHIFFLTELEFKAPFLVEDTLFTPALTTGFNSSVGGAFGWIIFQDFYFSRLFNFIWLVLEISLLNFYLYKNKIINVKFLYYSLPGLFCIPLWYNSLVYKEVLIRKTIKDLSLVFVAKEIFTLSELFLFSSLTFMTLPRHRIFLLIGKTVISYLDISTFSKPFNSIKLLTFNEHSSSSL